jgi:7-cyano-7-deazaguanine reductase
MPQYTTDCPQTGLPHLGKLTLEYEPAETSIELKSFKYYLLAYRNLGIFYENVVNRILQDVVRTVSPAWAKVEGQFTPRGGLHSTVTAEHGQRGGRG